MKGEQIKREKKRPKREDKIQLINVELINAP